MEPTDQPPVAPAAKENGDPTVVEFLPDADEIERSPLPRAAQFTVHALLATLVFVVLWATFSEVDQIVTARGRLVTPLPNIIVQPLETSIILSIDVRVGQVVKKGERLATLDPTFAQADEAQLRSRLGSLNTQSQRLESELAGRATQSKSPANGDSKLQAQLAAERQANFKAQATRMEESVARLNAALETNRLDQQVLSARVKSLQEIEAMQEKLVAQQYGAKVHLLEARDRRLEVERELLLTRNREQEMQRELAAAMADRLAFAKSWRQKAMEDLLSTSRDRDDVREQLNKADKRRRLVTLASPADAVVLDIAKLSQGSVVREAESLFVLVPLAAELEAEVQIDSVDVGYVKLNDRAHLKFDAFPFQRHGTLDGTVRTISEDAFRHDASTPSSSPEAFYMSRIAYGDSRLKKMEDRGRLLPGMTVSAEIVVGRRSVISYLLWPLTKALDESIKEP